MFSSLFDPKLTGQFPNPFGVSLPEISQVLPVKLGIGLTNFAGLGALSNPLLSRLQVLTSVPPLWAEKWSRGLRILQTRQTRDFIVSRRMTPSHNMPRNQELNARYGETLVTKPAKCDKIAVRSRLGCQYGVENKGWILDVDVAVQHERLFRHRDPPRS